MTAFSWLGGVLGRASAYDLAVNVPYALAFLLVSGEVAWIARRPGARRHAVVSSFATCWQVLEHTNMPVRFPSWFSAHVMTPAAHRQHHGRAGGAVNLGPVLTWWDRLAGTWVGPDCPPPLAYGLPTRPSANPAL